MRYLPIFFIHSGRIKARSMLRGKICLDQKSRRHSGLFSFRKKRQQCTFKKTLSSNIGTSTLVLLLTSTISVRCKRMPCKTIGGSRDIKPNQSHLDGWSTFHPGLPPPFMGRLGRTLQMLTGRYRGNSIYMGRTFKGENSKMDDKSS